MGIWVAMSSSNMHADELRDSVSKDNLNIELILAAPGKTATDHLLKLKISDAQTHQPASQIKPHAWLSLRRSEQVATETSCEAKVRNFTSGQLTTKADVDLNSYTLLTLNQDRSITFINPQVSWSGSKLESIVQLPEQGLDWVLTKDGKWLYVTMPKASAVAVIDTARHTLVASISTGQGSQPTRIALAPNEKSLWVGLDGSSKIAVVEIGDKLKVNFVNTGEGLHQIAFTPDSRTAVVTNSTANTLSVINVADLKKQGDIKVGNTPLKAVWLEKAERFYVIALNDSLLSVVDPIKQMVDSQIEVGRGAVDVAADPLGRYLWVVNQLESKAYVIDSATNQKVAYVHVTAEPDQIAFTAEYAYFRGLGSEKFALVNRHQLEKLPINSVAKNQPLTELSATQIQAGEKPPAALPDAVGVASMIASVPERNGVLVANAPGQTIYYYAEGMMVPMGTLDNYRRVPLALMILNRSLRETAPGLFEASVNVQESGNYDIAVLLDQPRLIHCFTAKLAGGVKESKPSSQAKIKLELLPLNAQPHANSETLISFRLVDSVSNQPISGLQDARLLAFEPPGLWQKREWLQETGEGIYQAAIIFPHQGSFNVLVEAMSRGLEFTGQALQVLKVQAPDVVGAK